MSFFPDLLFFLGLSKLQCKETAAQGHHCPPEGGGGAGTACCGSKGRQEEKQWAKTERREGG